ncbi:MAG TPA: hypothetical protein VGN37_04350 [Actinocatenispora sp.]
MAGKDKIALLKTVAIGAGPGGGVGVTGGVAYSNGGIDDQVGWAPYVDVGGKADLDADASATVSGETATVGLNAGGFAGDSIGSAGMSYTEIVYELDYPW